MTRELKLQIPEELGNKLEEIADRQGVPLGALCLSLLESKAILRNPKTYRSLSAKEMQEEKFNLMNSGLSTEEIDKRVRLLSNIKLGFIRK